MENLTKERVERIIDLVDWFEEYQPKDLEQLERIMLGLRYVDEEVVENETRQNIYRQVQNTKLDKNLIKQYSFSELIFMKDANERMKK